MKTDEYFGELDTERRKNSKLQWVLAACVAIILIQASSIRAQTGETKTAFLPPEIQRPFWISAEDASPEYFEQMGQFINLLPLNVTPETVAQACKQYLAYVLPRDRDAYKKKCDLTAARVKRDGSSQSFSTATIRTDAKNRRVVFTGVLTTVISDKVYRNNESYVLQFVHSDGRFYIGNHEKADPNDPFAQKK
jgi:conjugal transfer pilus assembly protein TraE